MNSFNVDYSFSTIIVTYNSLLEVKNSVWELGQHEHCPQSQERGPLRMGGNVLQGLGNFSMLDPPHKAQAVNGRKLSITCLCIYAAFVEGVCGRIKHHGCSILPFIYLFS